MNVKRDKRRNSSETQEKLERNVINHCFIVTERVEENTNCNQLTKINADDRIHKVI